MTERKRNFFLFLCILLRQFIFVLVAYVCECVSPWTRNLKLGSFDNCLQYTSPCEKIYCGEGLCVTNGSTLTQVYLGNCFT